MGKNDDIYERLSAIEGKVFSKRDDTESKIENINWKEKYFEASHRLWEAKHEIRCLKDGTPYHPIKPYGIPSIIVHQVWREWEDEQRKEPVKAIVDAPSKSINDPVMDGSKLIAIWVASISLMVIALNGILQ